MTELIVTRAERDDALYMVDKLCWGDKIEADALGLSYIDLLVGSFEQSIDAFTAKVDGEPVSMFGLTKEGLLDTKAIFWILSTEKVFSMSKRLIRHSREYLDIWLKEYDELYNYIHEDNVKALRWAKFLGAEMVPIPNMGKDGETFYKFSFFSEEAKKQRPSAVFKKFFESDSSLSGRDKIDAFEKQLEKVPGSFKFGETGEFPLQHHFSDGLFVRTMLIPKGGCLTGKIHSTEHPNFLLKGKISVYTEDSGIQVLEAPQIIISKAGVKKVGYALEDVLWTTVHVNKDNTHDISTLVERLTVDSYDELELREEIA